MSSFGQVFQRNRKRGRKYSDYDQKLSTQFIQQQKTHQNWMKNNYSMHLLNMPKFWISDPCRPFWNKITKYVDGPSITYQFKDEHFAENYIKIGFKLKK